MLEVIISTVIGVGFGAIATYIIAKKAFSEDRVLDLFDSVITELTENVDYQKRIYVIGGLLGQGIGANLGLRGKNKKFRVEDLALQFVPQLLGKFLNPQQQTTPTPNPTQTSKDAPLGEPFK